MIEINPHYQELQGNYLFAEIKRKVDAYLSTHPGADVIRLGIGDVTRPLAPLVVRALVKAAEEMGDAAAFRGYGPEQGYEFLREAILRSCYHSRRVTTIGADEIFVSDGSKCDTGNIQELFSRDCVVAIGDPVYPVYLDSNVMAGRGQNIVFLTGSEANEFKPPFPEKPVDLIYLCSPNNPTGTVLTREDLTGWVHYAHDNDSVILFDAAYSAFIRDPELPRSIYEIPGAEEVAIEFQSFSKSAGFTGVRCAWTVVPKALKARISLHALWLRRQCTKFNGVSYLVQRGAEAACSPEGRRENRAVIDYYLENARIIREGLELMGHTVFGGENAPYIWWKLPGGLDSMQFADTLLEKCQVVGTPGAGFGPGGEGCFRLTAFGDRERTREAMERIRTLTW